MSVRPYWKGCVAFGAAWMLIASCQAGSMPPATHLTCAPRKFHSMMQPSIELCGKARSRSVAWPQFSELTGEELQQLRTCIRQRARQTLETLR